MSFRLQQSGDLRRRGVEISVADLKEQASAGASFWRGLVIGLATGLVLSYSVYSGLVSRLWH